MLLRRLEEMACQCPLSFFCALANLCVALVTSSPVSALSTQAQCTGLLERETRRSFSSVYPSSSASLYTSSTGRVRKFVLAANGRRRSRSSRRKWPGLEMRSIRGDNKQRREMDTIWSGGIDWLAEVSPLADKAATTDRLNNASEML